MLLRPLPGHLKLADFGTAKRLQARCLPPLLCLHYNLLLALHLLRLHLLLLRLHLLLLHLHLLLLHRSWGPRP